MPAPKSPPAGGDFIEYQKVNQTPIRGRGAN